MEKQLLNRGCFFAFMVLDSPWKVKENPTGDVENSEKIPTYCTRKKAKILSEITKNTLIKSPLWGII
jgi:hypothetical protein